MKIARIIFGLLVVAIVAFVLYKAVDGKKFPIFNYGGVQQNDVHVLV
ncbi:MAG: hypothetical protein WCJ81_08715 [bacterium]